MELLPIIEQHYIIIGSNRYQIVFDAKLYAHDILIRGLFHWNPQDISKVNRIDFILDNLSSVKNQYKIHEAKWCSAQNRFELHIIRNSGTSSRSQATDPNFKEFDFKNKMELILRIYDTNQSINECEKLNMLKPNEHKFENLNGDKQKDKDGSILIGTTVLKP